MAEDDYLKKAEHHNNLIEMAQDPIDLVDMIEDLEDEKEKIIESIELFSLEKGSLYYSLEKDNSDYIKGYSDALKEVRGMLSDKQ